MPAQSYHPGQTAEQNGVLLDVGSGEKGSMPDWVKVFIHAWDKPRERLEQLLALLDENIILKDPLTPPAQGKTEARDEFLRAFHIMPDLRADFHHWSASGNVLFIELTLHATIGKQLVSWDNVDRFTFQDGVVIERVAFFDPTRIVKALTQAKMTNDKGKK